MRGSIYGLGIAMAAVLAAPVSAQDELAQGKALHERHCTACHGTEVYTRPDRRMRSLDMLQSQIGRCTRAAGADLNEQEQAALARYLNETFYHFE